MSRDLMIKYFLQFKLDHNQMESNGDFRGWSRVWTVPTESVSVTMGGNCLQLRSACRSIRDVNIDCGRCKAQRFLTGTLYGSGTKPGSTWSVEWLPLKPGQIHTHAHTHKLIFAIYTYTISLIHCLLCTHTNIPLDCKHNIFFYPFPILC